MKKQFTTFLISIIFFTFGVFGLANQAHAETEVSGNITSDITWTLADSPYVVKSDIGIVKGTTLTIEPGVKIIFNNGTTLRIAVAGSLQAVGTSEKQIMFTGSGEWEGIIFLSPADDKDINSTASSITYSVIERMRLGIHGGSQPLLISNNIIRDSNTGIELGGSPASPSFKISNNFITNNGRGITISHGGPYEISKNEITNNSIGIWTFYNNTGLNISYNNIYNNNTDNIYAQMGNSPVNASNNWWGTANELDISSKIHDYSDDIQAQVINYKPYASEKFSDTFSGSMMIACTSFTYSDWSNCQSNSTKTRTVISSSPNSCSEGSPILAQSCIHTSPTCTSWEYFGWSSCSASGSQDRSVISSSPNNCTGGSPILSQSCAPPQQSDIVIQPIANQPLQKVTATLLHQNISINIPESDVRRLDFLKSSITRTDDRDNNAIVAVPQKETVVTPPVDGNASDGKSIQSEVREEIPSSANVVMVKGETKLKSLWVKIMRWFGL